MGVVVGLIVVLLAGDGVETDVVEYGAKDLAARALDLPLRLQHLAAADRVVVDDKDNAVAGLGDLRGVDDHAHRRRVHQHEIELAVQPLKELGELLGCEERERIADLAAHGYYVRAGDVGLIEYILRRTHACQIVREAELRALLHAAAIAGKQHAAAQVGIDKHNALP